MSDASLTDEQLMAYADGQLPADQALQVEAAIARDPQIAARVQAFRATAGRLAALAAAQDATVPDALLARVRELAAAKDAPPAPVDLAAHRQAREARQAEVTPRGRPSWQIPLAASIALAIGLGAGLGLAPGVKPGAGHLAALDGAEVQQALRETLSGQRHALPDGGEVAVIASFTDGEGDLCREFEYDRPGQSTIVSVACHQGDGEGGGEGGGGEAIWQTQFAVLAAPSSDSGYAPASSLETLDAYLGAIQASQPLSDAEEAAALRQLP